VINLRDFASEGIEMNRFLVAILCLSICLPALAADGFSSLEEQMTGNQFRGAGLNKLTPGELEALNHWIRSHSLATLDEPRAGSYATSTEAGEDNKGQDDKDKKAEDMERTTIKSRIKGSFTGWDGHAVFQLENGMIWEQSDKDKFFIREVKNPEVTIEPGVFKTWHLSVDGHDAECRVKRIQ
jgi:hypothetical protein